MGRGKTLQTPQKPQRAARGPSKAAKKSSGGSHPSCVATVTKLLGGKRIKYGIAHRMPDPLPAAMCTISEAFRARGSWEDEYSDEPRGPLLSVTQIRDKMNQLLESYFRDVQDQLPKHRDASGKGFELARKWCEGFAKSHGVVDPCTSLMGIPEDAGAKYEKAMKNIGEPFLVYGWEPVITSSNKRAIAFHLGVGIGVDEKDVSVNFGLINHEWYYESVGSVSSRKDCEECTLVGLYPTEVEAEAALAKAAAADA